jgi:hypothetical protein
MTSVSYSAGYDAFGPTFMKFTLTYDGPLPAANKPKKEDVWRIRKELDPQLRDLWASHPALKMAEENRWFPKTGGTVLTQGHHLHPGPIFAQGTRNSLTDIIDLCEEVEQHSAWFRPLVRDSFALHCGLTLRFLRHEPPGKIYQGGDVDNRVKTLLDALSMPRHREQVLATNTKVEAIYCLMEDDSLVSGLNIESERLLSNKKNPADYVRLNIEVDVRVHMGTIYNQSFL